MRTNLREEYVLAMRRCLDDGHGEAIVLQAGGSGDNDFCKHSCNIKFSRRDEPETECMRTPPAPPTELLA